MSDYTPDTEEVRELYWAVSGDPRRESESWGEFDRWLRKIRAEAWDEGWTERSIYDARAPRSNPYV